MCNLSQYETSFKESLKVPKDLQGLKVIAMKQKRPKSGVFYVALVPGLST